MTGSIRQVEFRGDHYTRGRMRGKSLSETLHLPDLPGLSANFVHACRQAAEEFYPPIAREFAGIMDAGRFHPPAMEAYYFARLESRLGCTMLGIAGSRYAGEGSLAGRNYDWATSDQRWCELHRYSGGGLRRIGYTHHWAGCTDVLNEAGLYVAIASLPPRRPPEPGVQWNFIVERVSETCRTVAEAADVCAAARHLRPMSYLLADAHGDVAVIEATTADVRLREPENGAVIAANVPQSGRLLAEHAPSKASAGQEPLPNNGTTERALRRVARARESLSGDAPLTQTDLERVLADHTAPICTGDHEAPDGGHWSTLWSGVCEPATQRFLIAPGPPCRTTYQAFRLAP